LLARGAGAYTRYSYSYPQNDGLQPPSEFFDYFPPVFSLLSESVSVIIPSHPAWPCNGYTPADDDMAPIHFGNCGNSESIKSVAKGGSVEVHGTGTICAACGPSILVKECTHGQKVGARGWWNKVEHRKSQRENNCQAIELRLVNAMWRHNFVTFL